MFNRNALSIEPASPTDGEVQKFKLSGCIDARSDSALEVLRSVPAKTMVQLDFAGVQRINSMGLALLLKIFKQWEANDTRIEVINLSRMNMMLFKITGLGRFLSKGPPQDDSATPTAGPPPAAKPEQSRVAKSQEQSGRSAAPHSSATRPKPAAPPRQAGLRFTVAVRMRTGSRIWEEFAAYLQNHLGHPVRFENSPAHQHLSGTSADLLFAAPVEAWTMLKNHHFIPVMQTSGGLHQAVILARRDDPRTLEEMTQGQVAITSHSDLSYFLGREVCDTRGLDSSGLRFLAAKNEIRALQTLIRQQVDMLFISTTTYESLSKLSRKATRVLAESSVDFTHDLFCIAPQAGSLEARFREILSHMQEDGPSRQILDNTGIKAWQPPHQEHLDQLERLVTRYPQDQATGTSPSIKSF